MTRIARSFVGLALGALCVLSACSEDRTVTTKSTAVTVNSADPSGYPLAKGDEIEMPVAVPAGSSVVTGKVGDVFWLADESWAPLAGDGRVYVLAEVVDGKRWYQLISAGTATFPIGPVGHPSGCKPTATKVCPPDATPPPMVTLTVAA